MKKSSLITGTILKNIVAATFILACFMAGVYIVYTYLPVHVDWVRNGPSQVGVDWKQAFRPASLKLLLGESPYQVPLFHNPPWILLPLLPIALLPLALGSAVIYVLNLFSFVFVAIKLRTNVWLIPTFVLFSNIILNSINGNIEGLLAVAFILPPEIGLFFVLAKPQMGIAVAVFWAMESYRAGGFRKTIRVFLPVGVAYLISFIIFGNYITNSLELVDVWWNSSAFPEGVPIGVILLGIAIWKREVKFAIAASPFFAPYCTAHTWAFVWLGLLALFPQKIQLPKKQVAASKTLSQS